MNKRKWLHRLYESSNTFKMDRSLRFGKDAAIRDCRVEGGGGALRWYFRIDKSSAARAKLIAKPGQHRFPVELGINFGRHRAYLFTSLLPFYRESLGQKVVNEEIPMENRFAQFCAVRTIAGPVSYFLRQSNRGKRAIDYNIWNVQR